MLIQDGYQSSGSSTRHSSGNLGAYLDEDPACMSSGGSSRSSISSIPASVYTNLAEGMKPTTAGHDHGHSHPWDAHDRLDGGTLRPISANKLRQAAFRKPSSVKAMQMHTEDERDDDAFLTTPPKRRAGHQRYSDVSIRSVGSSSLRKSQSYSPTGSGAARKQRKEENEYPLVLLHCNLLPPSLPVPGAAAYHNQKILSEVLPPVFWRRWKLLEEKVGSQVLRERGVLISHPEDMYDLLEERLLESLELQRPRLDHGHFIGHDETESEKEDRSEKEESATDEEEGEPCPDCSGHVIRHGNAGRKWEIKVFAANGLMRAGAWAAAWREMEKVDVEVGLWLPSEVRRELEKRLMGEDYYSCHLEPQLQVPQLQVPGSNPVIHARPEARHARTSSSNTVDQRSFSFEEIKTPSSPAVDKSTPVEQQQPPKTVFSPLSADDIDIHTLLVNYLRVLASDRRNVTIAILSVLVVFFAIQSGSHVNSSALRPFPQDLMEAESLSIPVSSTKQIESVTSHSPTACVSQAAQSATTDIIIGEVPMSVSEVPDSTSGSISSAVMYAAVAESVPAFAGDISEPKRNRPGLSSRPSSPTRSMTETRLNDLRNRAARHSLSPPVSLPRVSCPSSRIPSPSPHTAAHHKLTLRHRRIPYLLLASI
ncbi:uncharacterized protein BP01DRAFT_373582 [Aspergillus saccharolyticus JOP 1030-1]|uniref:Flavoprotein oxygenase n=1 Tax=Aspergillus saccharolyticus JOP 1030-1 TaxID=1450539 RepID=A0A318ZDU7_9EURO|nr:hypothetical protein BP01DRAFT_373582 [Aspergillus saccharolyticus JOP 1030-1]PYH45691.1 hypothetical protein BP01DRAFT_373582 [Aspergillus saccharolyticus JOP 1030-1]